MLEKQTVNNSDHLYFIQMNTCKLISPLLLEKTKFQNSLLLILLHTIFFQGVFCQERGMVFEKNKETQIIGEVIHPYTVFIEKGEFLQLHLLQKNVNIQILALSPERDTIRGFNTNRTKDGLEIVELPVKKSGVYKFEISPFISNRLKGAARQKVIKNTNGSYRVKKFKVLSKKEYKELLRSRKSEQDSAISWVKNESITLKGVKAEIGLEDLMPLKSVLKNAQVVGLGEISHGTKEMFQMKHRMLEFLVKEMGFTIFGIEASNVGCRPINDYILYGKGSIREALGVQGFWIWNTEEMIDMIEWMKVYNTKVPDAQKVQFIGIDTQMVGIDKAYDNVAQFIEKTKLEKFPKVKVDSLFHYLKTTSDKTDLSEQRRELYKLLSHLILHKIRFIHHSSKQEYRNIISDLRKIIQGVESGDRGLKKILNYNIRDEYMAQTVLEEIENPKAKMMLWAHNSHITKNEEKFTNGYRESMGSVLKRYLKDKYYSIGFSTFEGSFQAREYSVKNKTLGSVTSFKIPPAKEGTLDWCFAQSKKEMFFINFNTSSYTNAVSNFLFKDKRKTYWAGANWTFEYSVPFTESVAPAKSYDGMIFIKETSAATLTPGGEKEIEKRLKEGR